MLIHWTSCRYFAQKMSLGHRYCRRQTIPQRFTVDTVGTIGICRLCMALPQNSWHTNLYKASKLSSKMPIDANYVLEVNVRDLPALGQCGGVKNTLCNLAKSFCGSCWPNWKDLESRCPCLCDLSRWNVGIC